LVDLDLGTCDVVDLDLGTCAAAAVIKCPHDVLEAQPVKEVFHL